MKICMNISAFASVALAYNTSWAMKATKSLPSIEPKAAKPAKRSVSLDVNKVRHNAQKQAHIKEVEKLMLEAGKSIHLDQWTDLIKQSNWQSLWKGYIKYYWDLYGLRLNEDLLEKTEGPAAALEILKGGPNSKAFMIRENYINGYREVFTQIHGAGPEEFPEHYTERELKAADLGTLKKLNDKLRSQWVTAEKMRVRHGDTLNLADYVSEEFANGSGIIQDIDFGHCCVRLTKFREQGAVRVKFRWGHLYPRLAYTLNDANTCDGVVSVARGEKILFTFKLDKNMFYYFDNIHGSIIDW